MTAAAAVEVMAENVTLRISRLCWRRGQPDGVLRSQSGLSQSGEGEGTRVAHCGVEWGGFCQQEANRTQWMALMSILRFHPFPAHYFRSWKPVKEPHTIIMSLGEVSSRHQCPL